MQARFFTHFARLMALAIFVVSILGPRPTAHAATAQQLYTCNLYLSGPARAGTTTVQATATVTCSGMVGRIEVIVNLRSPSGVTTSNSSYCYSVSSCSTTVSAALVEGTWTASASGAYWNSNGYNGFTPVSNSATLSPAPYAYYLKLHSIECMFTDDADGNDEPRLSVGGVQVWSSNDFKANGPRALDQRIKFTSTSLPITLKEYDAWPSTTVTFSPSPYNASTAEYGLGRRTARFSKGSSTYYLVYSVAYEQ